MRKMDEDGLKGVTLQRGGGENFIYNTWPSVTERGRRGVRQDGGRKEKGWREQRTSDREAGKGGGGGWRAGGEMNGGQASEGPPLSGQRVRLRGRRGRVCEYKAQCGDRQR